MLLLLLSVCNLIIVIVDIITISLNNIAIIIIIIRRAPERVHLARADRLLREVLQGIYLSLSLSLSLSLTLHYCASSRIRTIAQLGTPCERVSMTNPRRHKMRGGRRDDLRHENSTP